MHVTEHDARKRSAEKEMKSLDDVTHSIEYNDMPEIDSKIQKQL